MNKQETLALWEQGPAAWNEWAQEMLSRPDKGTAPWDEAAGADLSNHTFKQDQFIGVVFPGLVNFQGSKFSRTQFSTSKFSDYVDFADCTFEDECDLFSAVFDGDVFFNSSEFKRGAPFTDTKFMSIVNFYRAKFGGDASFHRATLAHARLNEVHFCARCFFIDAQFDGEADFGAVRFGGEASFVRTRFSRGVSFSPSTKFCSTAVFDGADFSGAADFRSARFCGPAHFRAAKSVRSFDMAGATFQEVPNFIQATFAEAPRLDNVVIQPERLSADDGPGRRLEQDDLPARWRALKRLALQGHDHVRELEYFAGELQALKRNNEKGVPGYAIFLYEHLSDFGRSILKPLGWWIAVLGAFWWLYLVVHLISAPARSTVATCTLPQAFGKALELSIHKALPLAGIASPEKLNQIYACLYGIRTDSALTERFTPVIPGWVYYPGMLQTLFSLVLIFLFLLALRNHFRIR